jgi:hypothetical protein
MQLYSFDKSHPVELIYATDGCTRLETRRYLVEFSLATDGSQFTNNSDGSSHQTKSFRKIMYWVQHILDQSIVHDTSSSDASDAQFMIEIFNNNHVFLPSSDEVMLCNIIMAKMNSLCMENSFVNRVKITDPNRTYSYEVVDTAPEDRVYGLPSQSEWMGEFSLWGEPWWMRDDFMTADSCADSQEELDQWRSEEEFQDVITKTQNLMARLTVDEEEEDEDEETTGEVIQINFSEAKKSKWTPKLV